jgi:hypothetical protein
VLEFPNFHHKKDGYIANSMLLELLLGYCLIIFILLSLELMNSISFINGNFKCFWSFEMSKKAALFITILL